MPRTKAAPKANGRPRAKAAPKSGRAKSKWTPEKLEQIPAPYRNCLKAFYRVVLSRGRRPQISLIPFSDLYTQVSYWHGLEVDETERVADELVRAGYIEGPDEYDFYALTPAGEELVAALLAYGRSGKSFLPAFPSFSE